MMVLQVEIFVQAPEVHRSPVPREPTLIKNNSMNATGISFELYKKIDDLADEWVVKAFMNSFVNVVEDIKKKDSIETNRVVDYLYTKMLDKEL
jgi:hypothetical protein